MQSSRSPELRKPRQQDKCDRATVYKSTTSSKPDYRIKISIYDDTRTCDIYVEFSLYEKVSVK